MKLSSGISVNSEKLKVRLWMSTKDFFCTGQLSKLICL